MTGVRPPSLSHPTIVSTNGVFPTPPAVIFPMLTTGTGG
jgi:hypothetical protein